MEGWDIFEAHNRLELQRIDDMTIKGLEHIKFPDPVFETDRDAWEFVVLTYSPLHTKALEYLRLNSPAEYQRIMVSPRIRKTIAANEPIIKKVSLDIDKIPEELYDSLLEEFQKQHGKTGLFDEWNVSAVLYVEKERPAAKMKISKTVLARIKRMIEENNHSRAFQLAADKLGLVVLSKRFGEIIRKQELCGELPAYLYERRRELYNELMAFAKTVLDEADFQKFYDAF
jgi:hypothetical protein